VKPLAPGLRGAWHALPGFADSAAAAGNTGVAVVSSQALIGWCEQAAHRAIADYHDPGEATLGVGFDLAHVAPARLGSEVVAEAEVVAVEGRRISFEVRAAQDGVTLLHGRHERVVVDFARFLDQAGLPPPRQPLCHERLEFWFDFHSPWCYLASHRIGALARRHGLALSWRPVHLPRLLQAIDGRRQLEQNVAFLRWYHQDLADWAALLGLPLSRHPDYPLRPARALRAAFLVASDPETRDRTEAFVQRVMCGYWAEGANIEDYAVLAELATDAGLDGARVAESARDRATKDALAANLDEAIAAGVFGVPTVALGEKLYFGNDRLELLELHLNGVAAPGETKRPSPNPLPQA
jgi:2-hydroxychromene-2-carboxylate isomerase/predicted thioesterase